MTRSRRLRLLFWLALALLLAYGLRFVPWQATWQTLARLSLGQVAALVLLNSLILLLFTSRGWLILHLQGYPRPYPALFAYRLAAFAVSYFTPGAQFGGEPLQVYLLQTRQGLPAAVALTAVSLDKLFELLANFTFLAVGVSLAFAGGLLPGVSPLPALAVSGGLLLLPLVYLAVLWAGRFPLTWLILGWTAWPVLGRLAPADRLAPLYRLATLVVATEQQISTLFRRRPVMLLWVLFLSGLIWALMLAEYWLMLRFLGVNFDLIQTITALTAARLAFLTPLPGGLAALEAGQALVLANLGAGPAAGISASLLIRARDVTFGLIGLALAGHFARSTAQASLAGRSIN